MQLNQNYPWYMQRSESFSGLYVDLFDIVSAASPLDIYKIFYPDELTQGGLVALGKIWAITGDPAYTDALIYDLDQWSQDKVWTGGMGTIIEDVFRRLLKAKIYMQGRQICLDTLKKAFDIIFEGTGSEVTITEDYMSFTINVSGTNDTIRAFMRMRSLDVAFIGALPGIHYDYVFTDIPDENPEETEEENNDN